MNTAQDQQSRATGWTAPKDRYAMPVLFNPYTGEPRDARDVRSDPQGNLIAPPGVSWQAARALPAGMEPLCYLRPAAATTPARAWQAWENDGTAEPVYTAAQVLAMGRVPPEMPAPDFYLDGGSTPCFYASTVQASLSAAPRPPAAMDVPTEDTTSYLAQLFGPGPTPRPPAAQERAYICPTSTVADLVNNLLLLDQALPIYGAQYIEHPPGKRRAIAVHPTVSRERVKDGRWIGEGDQLNAAVIWTRAEKPAAQEGA